MFTSIVKYSYKYSLAPQSHGLQFIYIVDLTESSPSRCRTTISASALGDVIFDGDMYWHGFSTQMSNRYLESAL